MIEDVRGTKIGVGRMVAYVESLVLSHVLMSYFWGMGIYFYWGDGSIYVLGGWSKSLGDESPIPPGVAPLIACNVPYETYLYSILFR